mgnify:CR=1 FL=1
MKETLKSVTRVAFHKVIRMSSGADSSEMRLTGLILAQSALVGVAVGIYDAGIWLPAGSTENHWVNGMTYSMGALAIQMLAFYVFKMFFEQQMMEKARLSEMQRTRNHAFREQQFNYDNRRMDMELRMQEMQLEKELLMLQNNPSQLLQQESVMPQHTAIQSETLSMGLDNIKQVDETPVPPAVPGVKLKADGTPDLRYKKGSGKV